MVAAAHDERLVRGIGRWDFLALTINGIVGAGIFGLPSTVYGLAGAWTLAAYVGCAVAIGLVMLCFAEVGSRFHTTGGPYLYARWVFGPLVGFEVGWLAWVARVTAFVALSHLFVTYLELFVPWAGSRMGRPLLVAGLALTYTAVNLRGVRHATVVADLLTIGKLAVLVLVILGGLFALEPERLLAGTRPDAPAFWRATLLLVFAFSGFEAVVVATGEVRDPGRNVPWALLTALAVVATVYFLVQLVCIGTVPGLAASTRPIADAGSRIFGPVGGAVATVGALVSIGGTLGGIMLVAPRLTFAMAGHGDLPRWLGVIHPQHRTPYASILVCSAAVIALGVAGSFVGALTLSTVIRVFTYLATCAALPVLRRRPGVPAAAFRVPLGSAVAVLALLLCVWLLLNSGWPALRDAGIAAALGVPLHLVSRKRES